ncbi:NUDIX hydrolase domain [Trinorchestia longiramus]|nr:NUDIX hydrolase domain [Trinorchestia longiramus]
MSTNGIGSYRGQEELLTAPLPQVPRSLRVRSVIREMRTFAEAQALHGCRSAAHACFWAPCHKTSVFGTYKAAVMMHLRFDGTFGFPGGFVEDGEDMIEGLTRELKEELAYDPSIYRPITYNDYHNSRVVDDKQMVLHMFIVELSLEQFTALEKNAVTAREYGREVLGTVRVPLYTMSNRFGGLPAFLNNRFIGCAKQELLMVLFSIGILTDDDIDELVHNANNMKLAPSRI